MKIRHALLATACTAVAATVSFHAYGIDLVAQEKAREAQQNTVDHPFHMERDYIEDMNAPAPANTVRPGAGARPGLGARNGRHYLFVATPGDGGADGESGFVVLDADNGFRFVNRIPYGYSTEQLPGEKVTGISASVPLNMVYVAYEGSLKGFDLNTDKLAWTFNGKSTPVVRHYSGANVDGCCERPWTLPDGKTLLVGSSYNNWWYYINAATGAVEGKVMTPDGPIAHNMCVTPDGKMAFLGSLTPTMSIVDVPNRKVIRTITFSDSVRPLTINHDGSLVYATLNNLDGFEIGDSATGKVVSRVELPGEMWKAKWHDLNNHFFGHSNPSHGIGLTPDESEIWVSDDVNVAWQIWDNTGDVKHPVYNPAKTVPVTPGVSSSWISMTNDGKIAYLGDGSVVDVPSHKVVAVLKDERGQRLHVVEKALMFTIRDGKMVETNNQFAVGDPKAYAARIAAGGKPMGEKQASN